MQYGNRTGGGGPDGGTAYVPARADGCHPVDGCQDGTPFYGSVFQYLAANVTDTSTGNPLLPPYRIVNTSDGREDRLRRRDARGDAADRHANGRGRTRVPRRGRHGQRARRSAEAAQGEHDRAAPARGRPAERALLAWLHGREQVRELHRAGPAQRRQPARPGRRPRRQRPHAPAVRVPLQRQARHVGRLVRPVDHVDRPDHRSASGHDGQCDRGEPRRHADRRERPGRDLDSRRVQEDLRPDRQSGDRLDHGGHLARRAARSTAPTGPASSRWAT